MYKTLFVSSVLWTLLVSDTLAIEGVKGRHVHHDRPNSVLNSTVQAGLCYKRIRWVERENSITKTTDAFPRWIATMQICNKHDATFNPGYRHDAHWIRSFSLLLFSYADALALNATGQFPHNTLPSTPQEGTVNVPHSSSKSLTHIHISQWHVSFFFFFFFMKFYPFIFSHSTVELWSFERLLLYLIVYISVGNRNIPKILNSAATLRILPDKKDL